MWWHGIRMFGLAHCDLPTMIWNADCMLRFLTVNIDKRNTKKIPLISYVSTVLVIACYFYVYLISMVWFVFWRCRETGDVLAGIIVFSLGITSEISVTKLFFLLLNEKKMRNVVNDYLAMDALIEPNSRFSIELMKTLRLVKKRALIFWAVIVGNGFLYILKAWLLPGKHMMEDNFEFLGFESMYTSPYHEIAFAINIAGVFVTCYLPANITGLFIIVAGYTEAHILALSKELEHLWSDATKHTLKTSERATAACKTINKFIKIRLEYIVKSHATNKFLLRQLELVFHGAIAIEFLFLSMGLTAEILGGLEKTYIELPYALMLVATDCFIGQRVIDASLHFRHAVYNCHWENFDIANQKIVLMILKNSQKTMSLSAGGFMTLSFTCFMSVIRSTYSAYTTLRTVMN